MAFMEALKGTQQNLPRVLVTGASGLLGRQVLKELNESWEVRGLCLTRQRAGLTSCDLTIEGNAAAQIQDFRPDVVVHLAAERRPEVLHKNPAKAEVLNVDATVALAAACERAGAWLVFMSTDHVFDGTAAPYAEDAVPNPVTEYGRQKLRAEQAVRQSPRATVLRFPVLYGPVEFIKESAVTGLFADLKAGAKKADDWQLRYPTSACDVAGVLRSMLDLHRSGKDLRGTFHWQSSEQFTKYEVTCLVADIAMHSSPILPDRSVPSVQRPENTRLSCARLEKLLEGGKFRTPLRTGLQKCLMPFLGGNLSVTVIEQPGVAPPACACSPRRGNDDKRPLLRRRIRSTKQVLRQASADVHKLQQVKANITDELSRLNLVQNRFQSLAKDQQAGLLLREKQIEETLNAKMKEEGETVERIVEMQRLLLSPSAEGDRSLLGTDAQDGFAYAAAANAASGIRQSRATGPALEGEVMRLRLENELEIARLRDENAHLRRIMDAHRVEEQIAHMPSTPRLASPRFPESPNQLASVYSTHPLHSSPARSPTTPQRLISATPVLGSSGPMLSELQGPPPVVVSTTSAGASQAGSLRGVPGAAISATGSFRGAPGSPLQAAPGTGYPAAIPAAIRRTNAAAMAMTPADLARQTTPRVMTPRVKEGLLR